MKKDVKDTALNIADLPMMTFDEEGARGISGWRAIYLGLYSPFTNKYTQYM